MLSYNSYFSKIFDSVKTLLDLLGSPVRTFSHHHFFSSALSTTGRNYMASTVIFSTENESNGQLLFIPLSKTTQGSTSQKYICLWPLPTITSYTVLLSVFVSTLNYLGYFDLICSAPSFVIYEHKVANLFISPFLFTINSVSQILLYLWNTLIFGLLEVSLTQILGSSGRFFKVFVGLLASVCVLRQGLGYLFSRSTGWAVPILFFSDAIHECNQGLSPFLFALAVIQTLQIEDKYILFYDQRKSFTVHKVVLQLLMCLVNYTAKNILWWSLTGLLVGLVGLIFIHCWLVREMNWNSHITTYEDNNRNTLNITDSMYKGYQSIPLWRSLYKTCKKGLLIPLCILPIMILWSGYYTKEHLVNPATLNQLDITQQDQYMFTFVVMTAPRRSDPPLLTRTIDSYIQNWPENPTPHSLYDRMQMLVYTHFSVHTEFDRAQSIFSNTTRGQQYLKWVREEGDTLDQRTHVSQALALAVNQYQSTYVALLEDDFPICGTKEWRQLESLVYAANAEVPDHCGIFVATGGSGLLLKSRIAKLVSDLLLVYPEMPPDVMIQDCLLGRLPECGECSRTLVTSKTMLMYHIGYNTSTSSDRSYGKDQYQCGWRHPFNGKPYVKSL